jgi:hypothetical protein
MIVSGENRPVESLPAVHKIPFEEKVLAEIERQAKEYGPYRFLFPLAECHFCG